MAATIIRSEIEVPFPDAAAHKLELNLGACRVHVTPDADPEFWVLGYYDHPEDNLPPRIRQSGGTITIEQKVQFGGLSGLVGTTRKFELAFGAAKSYALTLQAGAYEGDFDFGGLPLTQLRIRQGAGKSVFDFSQPNPGEMSELNMDAGAMSVEMKNLANAGFAEMRVNGGAGEMNFDFGGTLRRNATVRIMSGVSAVNLNIPRTTPAKIEVERRLGSIDVGDGFLRRDSVYMTEAAVSGGTPMLSIRVDVSLGSLSLKSV